MTPRHADLEPCPEGLLRQFRAALDPELEARMTETVAERSFRLKQRALNLQAPLPETRAA
jgi:hypothetical protein